MTDFTKRTERESLRRAIRRPTELTATLLDACDTLEQQRDAAIKECDQLRRKLREIGRETVQQVRPD